MLNAQKIRYIQTCLCVLSMFSAGLSQGVLNPTLPDLQHLTSSTQTQMSFIFVTSGIGCIIGSLLGGPLFDRFNGFMCLALAGILLGALYALAPFCPNFVGFITLICICHIPNFAIVTGAYAVVIKLWKDSPSLMFAFIQAIQLMQTFGMAVIPLIAEPFLGDYRNLTSSTEAVTTSYDVIATTRRSYTIASVVDQGNNIHIVFLILGAIDVVVGFICFLGVLLKQENAEEIIGERVRFTMGGDTTDESESTPLLSSGRSSDNGRFLSDIKEDSAEENTSADRMSSTEARGKSIDHKPGSCHNRSHSETDHSEETTVVPEYSKHRHLYQAHKILYILYLLTGFLFFAFNGGRDVILSGLLYNYVTMYLNFSPETGALLVTVYQLVKVFGQLFVMILTRWVKPLWVGIADMVLLVAGSLLLLFTYHVSDVSVWVAILVQGLAACNVFPTAMSVVEETVPVTAKMSGLLWSGMSLGMMGFTPLTSALLEVTGSPGVPIPLLVSAVACTALFIPLILIGWKLRR